MSPKPEPDQASAIHCHPTTTEFFSSSPGRYASLFLRHEQRRDRKTARRLTFHRQKLLGFLKSLVVQGDKSRLTPRLLPESRLPSWTSRSSHGFTGAFNLKIP